MLLFPFRVWVDTENTNIFSVAFVAFVASSKYHFYDVFWKPVDLYNVSHPFIYRFKLIIYFLYVVKHMVVYSV